MGQLEAEAAKSISMLLLVLTSAGLGSFARSYLGALALSATVFIIGQLVLDFAGIAEETLFEALFDPPRLGYLLGQLVAVWILMALMWMIAAGARRIARAFVRG